MRRCPKCGEHSLSETVLIVHAFTGMLTINCIHCHSTLEFKRRISTGAFEFLMFMLPEIILFILMISSIFLTNSIFSGVAVFLIIIFLRSYYVLKGPLVAIESSS